MLKRTIVFGDIHGCYNQLMMLLNNINYDPASDRLIFLGDYIDRGKDSYLVVKMIKSLQENAEYQMVVPLLGNHEDMLIDYFECEPQYKDECEKAWFDNGGMSTILDYKRHGADVKEDLEWFKKLNICVQDENYMYVHAGLRPFVSLNKQSYSDILWIREQFYNNTYKFDKPIVFGHSPVQSITNLAYDTIMYSGDNIAMDTGCYFSGKLSCLDLSALTYYETIGSAVNKGILTKQYQDDCYGGFESYEKQITIS